MLNRQYKCPVCGAPVDGYKCEYCGCIIYDFAVIDTDQPTYIRMRIRSPSDGKDYIMQMKAVAVNPCVEIKYDEVDAVGRFDDSRVARFIQSKTCTMSVDFQAVTDEKDVLFT